MGTTVLLRVMVSIVLEFHWLPFFFWSSEYSLDAHPTIFFTTFGLIQLYHWNFTTLVYLELDLYTRVFLIESNSYFILSKSLCFRLEWLSTRCQELISWINFNIKSSFVLLEGPFNTLFVYLRVFNYLYIYLVVFIRHILLLFHNKFLNM